MAVEDLMSLEFLHEAANIVLIGPNGVGKSTIAANIAHRAILEGHNVRFTNAGNMLGDSPPSTAIAGFSAGYASTPASTCW